MAAFDSNGIPFKGAVSTATLGDGGANTLLLKLVQGSITWSEPGRAYVEAMERGRHQSTPVVVETDDGNCSGSCSFLVDSYDGSSAATPYEFLTFSGSASAFATTSAGGRKTFKLTVTMNSTVDGGGSQTAIFAHCVLDSIEVDDGGTDGLMTLTFNWTDLESRPTYA
jgi:hypothetical protein